MNLYLRRTLSSLIFLDTRYPLPMGLMIYSVHVILVTPIGRLPSVAKNLNERLLFERADVRDWDFEASAFERLLYIA